MMIHPRKNEDGTSVSIHTPHTPTPLATWSESTAVATVVPDSPMPPMVNDVTIDPPGYLPPDRADWEQRAREMDFKEPPFDAKGSKPAAGAVVVEPDSRLWLVSPTNGFGQYTSTFPKGKSHGMSLKATALKEVFEEAGLQVELFAHLIDVTKTTSRTRYYLGRRKGGNPADMCWEVQAVHLVPLEQAKGMLNQKVDHQVIGRLHERRDEWAGWFSRLGHSCPDGEIDPNGQGTADEEMSLDEIRELRKAFGLPPLDNVDPELVAAEFERLFGKPCDPPISSESHDGVDTPIKKPSSKVGRPVTMPGPIGVLAQKVGGVGLLAEELDVSVRTVRRWATGGTIPPLPLKMLGLLFEKHQVEASGLTPDGISE